MNIVEVALKGEVIKDGEYFECLPIMDVLLEKQLITWDTYHLFISHERSCGPIPGVMKNGVFNFPFEYDEGTYTLESDMFTTLKSLINFILNN